MIALFNKIFVAIFFFFSLWMFSVSFLVRLFARGFLGLLGGVVFTVLGVALEMLRVMVDMGVVLKDTFVSLVRGLSMIRLG